MRNYNSKCYFEEELYFPVRGNDGSRKAFRQFRKEKRKIRLVNNERLKKKALKYFGTKKARGSHSKKNPKKGGDYMHFGGGKRGRKIRGNSRKTHNVCPCHPTCEPKFHKRKDDMFYIKNIILKFF